MSRNFSLPGGESMNVQLDGKEFSLDLLIDAIYAYRNESKETLIEKFEVGYLLTLLDKDKIVQLEQKQKLLKQKGIDILDFVFLFLKNIEHNQDETLYLTLSLIDLFKEISETKQLTNLIKFQDVTSYISEQISYKDEFYQIKTQKMPPQQMFNYNKTKIREIDITAPFCYGETYNQIKRLQKNKLITDSTHHENSQVRCGFYAKSINKIIILDALSDKLNFYDNNCKLTRILKPLNNKASKNDLMIMRMVWSERQQRIGACLKNFQLVFWDAEDNFKYEKYIETFKESADLQIHIFYLEFANTWITVDDKKIINIWDIEEEKIQFSLKSDKIKRNIFEILEIPLLKLVAIGSLDKVITFWNFEKRLMVFSIEIPQGGCHTMRFFHSYSRLITVGFNTVARIYYINPIYFDVSVEGLLSGHTQSITAMEVIEDTPMVITADDMGNMKVWDIRSLNCMQNINFGERTVVMKLISIYEHGKISFIGTRLNVIDFEEGEEIERKLESPDILYPIKVVQNIDKRELIIATRKEVRFYDLIDGRMKYFLTGLLKNQEEDEITGFKLINHSHNFIIGNHRGHLNLHSCDNGNLLMNLNSHQNEISQIQVDYTHNIIISSGYDSSIIIQKLHQNKNATVIRQIDNMYYNKQIKLVEVSVWHNLLIATSTSNEICLFDYEYVKLLSIFQLKQGIEPTSISFINSLSIIVIGSNDGMVYLIHFIKKDFHIEHKIIAKIDVNKENEQKFERRFSKAIINQNIQSEFLQFKSKTRKQSIKSNGIFSTFNINQNLSIKPGDQTPPPNNPSNTQQQSNSENKNNAKLKVEEKENNSKKDSEDDDNNEEDAEDFEDDEDENNKDKEKTSELNNVPSKKKKKLALQIPVENQQKGYAQKILIDHNYLDKRPDNQCTMIIGTNRGFLFIYDLKNILNAYKIQPNNHVNKEKANYNPYRKLTENYIKEIQGALLEQIKLYPESAIKNPCTAKIYTQGSKNISLIQELQSYKPLTNWQAHKDLFTELEILQLKEKHILTSSLDSYIKIWNFQGFLVGSLNINHPLPIRWTITSASFNPEKEKIIYGMRVLDAIMQKYLLRMTAADENLLKLTDFLMNIAEKQGIWRMVKQEWGISKGRNINQKEFHDKRENMTTENQFKNSANVMVNEYSPYDLKFDQVRKIFKREIQGPNLKNIDSNQRIQQAMKQNQFQFNFRVGNIDQKDYLQNAQDLDSIIDKNIEKEQIATFLSPDYKQKLLNKKHNDLLAEEDEDFGIQESQQQLSNKLDSVLKKSQKKDSNNIKIADQNLNTETIKKIISQKQTNSILFSNTNDRYLIIRPFKGEEYYTEVQKQQQQQQQSEIATEQQKIGLKQNQTQEQFFSQQKLQSQQQFDIDKSNQIKITNQLIQQLNLDNYQEISHYQNKFYDYAKQKLENKQTQQQQQSLQQQSQFETNVHSVQTSRYNDGNNQTSTQFFPRDTSIQSQKKKTIAKIQIESNQRLVSVMNSLNQNLQKSKMNFSKGFQKTNILNSRLNTQLEQTSTMNTKHELIHTNIINTQNQSKQSFYKTINNNTNTKPYEASSIYQSNNSLDFQINNNKIVIRDYNNSNNSNNVFDQKLNRNLQIIDTNNNSLQLNLNTNSLSTREYNYKQRSDGRYRKIEKTQF